MIGGIVRLSRRCGWYGECVGSGSDPGEEAEAGPFGELGEDVARLDLELRGEFCVMYDLAGSIGAAAHC